MSSPQLTLAQVIEQAPGDRDNPSYIDGEFEVEVLQAYPNKGRMPSSMNVCDPHSPAIKAKVKMFGRNLSQYKGKLIRIGGSGNKRDEYNGSPEIILSSKNADLHILGDARRAAAPANTQRSTSSAPRSTASAGQRPEAGQSSTGFHAQMKRLALFYCHCLDYADKVQERYGELSDTQRVECVRGLFIEGVRLGLPDAAPAREPEDDVPMRYEQSNPPQRQEAAPPTRPAPPAAGPDGSVALSDEDSDVPF